jgi:hypothetical protein
MGFKELCLRKLSLGCLLTGFPKTKTGHFLTLPMNILTFLQWEKKFPAAISQPITAMNRRQAGRWVDEL